jgi:hypothetical protein
MARPRPRPWLLSRAGFVELPEFFEDFRLPIGWNANACVDHVEPYAFAALAGANEHTALCSVAQRIFNQITQDPF